MKRETKTQTAIRIPDPLLAHIDMLVEHMNKIEPGRRVTRTEVIRMAVFHGVAELDNTYNVREKKGSRR